MRFLRLLGMSAILLGLNACHTLNSVSLTQIPQQRNKKVKAEVSKLIVLGLSFDNDYVDSLVDKLKAQCDDGMVRGILTKDEVVDYFLMIVHSRVVSVSGYCVSGSKKLGMLEPQP
jgi:hypothetical protein